MMSRKMPLQLGGTSANRSSSHLSAAQKDCLLDFMGRNERNREFARWPLVKPADSTLDQTVVDGIWQVLAKKLNELEGPVKTVAQWKKSWSGLYLYALKLSKSAKSRPNVSDYFEEGDGVSSDDTDPYDVYTTGNAEADRVMKIIGWQTAFNHDLYLEDDRENLPPPPAKRQATDFRRSISPVSSIASSSGAVPAARRFSSPTPQPKVVAETSGIVEPVENLIKAVADNTAELGKVKRTLEEVKQLLEKIKPNDEAQIFHLIDMPPMDHIDANVDISQGIDISGEVDIDFDPTNNAFDNIEEVD